MYRSGRYKSAGSEIHAAVSMKSYDLLGSSIVYFLEATDVSQECTTSTFRVIE
jgi:hypothetical protein